MNSVSFLCSLWFVISVHSEYIYLFFVVFLLCFDYIYIVYTMDFKQAFCSFGAVVDGLGLLEVMEVAGDNKEVYRSLVVWWTGVVREWECGWSLLLLLVFSIYSLLLLSVSYFYFVSQNYFVLLFISLFHCYF